MKLIIQNYNNLKVLQVSKYFQMILNSNTHQLILIIISITQDLAFFHHMHNEAIHSLIVANHLYH